MRQSYLNLQRAINLFYRFLKYIVKSLPRLLGMFRFILLANMSWTNLVST